MAPELPFLAAGAVALVGGARREGKFPANGIKALVATAILVLIASATANTSAAPLVRALGLITLLGAVFGAARTLSPAKDKSNG